MITIRLLGAPSLVDAAGTRHESLLAQPKRFAILAYLAVEARGAPVTRDKVASIFWPELDQARARQALRQSLHVLRKEIGEDAITGVGAEMLEVNAGEVAADTAMFDEAVAAGRLADALVTYRGHFMDGFFVSDAPDFEQWAASVRTKYRDRAVAAARTLAQAAESAGDTDGAIGWLQQQLALADIDEPPLRRLLELLRRQGNGAAAVAAYDAYVVRMHREMELEPSPETVALAQAIRAEVAASGPPEVRSAAAYQAPATGEPAGPATGVRSEARPIRMLFAATALLVVIGAVVSRGPGVPAADLPPSVAVLPFLDLSEAKDQQYLSDGLTEELITALSKVRGLKVTARTSSFAYRDTRSDIPRIARELRVASVLEGSVRRDGDQLRITAQLIDARTGYHIWTENYERKISDLFTVQEEIARAIAGTLRVELVGVPASRLAGRTTDRVAAYESYLRGLFFWNQRNESGVRKAIDHFGAALTIDSTYAAAWAGLADALQFAPTFEVLRPDSAFPAARRAIDRALALDAELAEAHASLGYYKLHWERDWPGAEASLRRAIDLNPGYATAHQWLRIGYIAMGRFDDAIAESQRARDLDPLSISIHAALGDTYMYAGRYAAAESAYTRAIELSPDYDRAAVGIARVAFLLGRTEEGVARFEKALAGAERNSRYAAHLAYLYAQVGRRRDAERIVSDLRRESRSRYVPPYAMTVAAAALGNADSVRYWRNRAIAERDNWAIYIDAAPELKGIMAGSR